MDVFSDSISTKIEHRLVLLESATDILRFSFIAQNSISPLDLAQQEGFNFYYNEFSLGFRSSSILDSTIQYPKYAINTEEKCRKILSRTRDFLYRLHLDLPKKRECSLKEGLKPTHTRRINFRRHIGKITVHPNFHFTVLASLVKEAVKRSDKKLKMIKWLVTFDAVKQSTYLSNQHAYYFAKYMYSEVTDSAFVKAFLKKVDFYLWIINYDLPEILEFFLYHLRRNGSIFIGTTQRYEPIEFCIRNQNFLNIEAILKYQDAPRVPSDHIIWSFYKHLSERGRPSDEVLREAEKRMSPRRFYLMMQFLYIFLTAPTKSAAKCLRLLWNGLPDAFFSFEEIEMALEAGMSPKAIRDLYNFYSGAVGVFHERVEPRSLKHLSRPAVRRLLWDNGCWIPDGIKLIGVPRELQSFLNLEA